jgi:hypothetical protein
MHSVVRTDWIADQPKFRDIGGSVSKYVPDDDP